jgi:hypothetical protein
LKTRRREINSFTRRANSLALAIIAGKLQNERANSVSSCINKPNSVAFALSNAQPDKRIFSVAACLITSLSNVTPSANRRGSKHRTNRKRLNV